MKTEGKKKEALDWLNVRGRLQRALAAAEESHQLAPERVRAILEARARAAAQIPATGLAAAAAVEVVRFELGTERYAIATAFVREILQPLELAPLPGTPDFLLGIINLRGQIVAVFDLRQTFGAKTQGVTEGSRLIVLGQERIEFGLIADAVAEVALLPLDAIREVPASTPAGARDWLRGVTADAVLVLDGAALLNDPRLYIDLRDDAPGASLEVQS